MNFRYDNSDDAHQQLDNSVMMTDGGAIYLKYYQNWNWEVMDLSTGVTLLRDLREVGLTFEPLHLGYINMKGGAYYLLRSPRRMWKQGLTTGNIISKSGSLPSNFITSLPLNKCLINEYLTIQEAYTSSLMTIRSYAFHRDFAFVADNYPEIRLHYKGENIGVVGHNLSLRIDAKFHYLKEILSEVICEQD